MFAPAPNKILAALVCTLLASSLAGALPAVAAAGPTTVGVYDSLANLRPDRPVPAGASQQALISAAANEAESFQLLVQAGPTGSHGLSVEPGAALTGPGGATLPATAMTIYRESYYQVSQRSDGEGESGAWPDALIPARDDFYGESRSAFPVDLAAAGQLAVWVDVLVPVGQPAGAYSGSVLVKDAGGAIATVPVTVTVLDFSLPSTSSLKSAFFVSSGKICSAFTGSAGCESAAQAWQFEALFAEAGLNNRVSVANAYAGSPTSSYFNQYFLPLVQGTDSRVRLPGAKLTSVEVYGPSCGNCLGPWKTAAQQYGFDDRFFFYTCDEPESSAEWEQCKANAQSAEQQWPGVRNLVTAPVTASAASYVDTFTPLVNDIAPASGSKRSAYNGFLSEPGKGLWLYTSCRSYSCDSSEGPSYNGWPGYAIDEPASQARAMSWISFLYGASGELYYSATQSLTTATTNQYASGGNGDGNLFYAGTPAGGNGSIAIGGSHPIPIESIRLKRIRDGREDYEYLHILEQRGESSQATGIVKGVFGPESSAGHSTTVSSAALNSARTQLAVAIDGQTGSEGPPPAEPPVEAEAPAPKPSPAPAPGTGKPIAQARAVSWAANAAPAAADTGSPQLKVLRVQSPRSARKLGSAGVRALVVCVTSCRVDIGATLPAGVARRLGLATTQIGSGSARVPAGRPSWIVVRLTGAARRKLLQADGEQFHLRTDVTASLA